jgi:hypothetical protein
VAGSNNSRNGPMPEIQAAVSALLTDTEARFPIDSRRVYATGFSGGARVATGLAMGCRGCVRRRVSRREPGFPPASPARAGSTSPGSRPPASAT